MSDFHWDYEVFLFIGTLATALAWFVSRLLKRQHKASSKPSRTKQTVVAVGGFFPILFLVLSVRSFAYEPYRIPSSSMMPTLLTGDFILVDKSVYGIKMPVFHNTLLATGHPQRGDVVVFRSVEDPSVDVIKRVIGVPGDHIRYDEDSKQVFVNGEPLVAEDLGQYTGFSDDIDAHGLHAYASTTGDQAHQVLHSKWVHHRYPLTELVVPEGHYFGMGDNRDFSKDSRIFGLISERHVVGQAKVIWMHWRPDDFIAGLKRVGRLL